MKIDYYENNCGLVALHSIIPDRDETAIVAACMEAGFEPDIGMLPHHIHKAAELLGLEYERVDLVSLKPDHYKGGDMRRNLTLHQALIATSDDVCLIRVSGHVLASNRGVPLDPNIDVRGSRRRVLEIIRVHNATIPARRSWVNSSNPVVSFVRDLTIETQQGSYRRKVYDRIFNKHKLGAHVHFETLRRYGYTKKMMRRHFERGDLEIITE